MTTTVNSSQIFKLYLIKPSHYDDDGYVIQWLRSAIPSNTLAVMHGLAVDCNDRLILVAAVIDFRGKVWIIDVSINGGGDSWLAKISRSRGTWCD